MARFVLDVANLTPRQIEKVKKQILNTKIAGAGVSTINCIDETNENQFYPIEDINSGKTNEFSQAQIETFKKLANIV